MAMTSIGGNIYKYTYYIYIYTYIYITYHIDASCNLVAFSYVAKNENKKF